MGVAFQPFYCTEMWGNPRGGKKKIQTNLYKNKSKYAVNFDYHCHWGRIVIAELPPSDSTLGADAGLTREAQTTSVQSRVLRRVPISGTGFSPSPARLAPPMAPWARMSSVMMWNYAAGSKSQQHRSGAGARLEQPPRFLERPGRSSSARGSFKQGAATNRFI